MEIILKVSSSESYDGADYALLVVSQDTIQTIARTTAAAKALAVTLPDFAYLEVWDYSPTWFEMGPQHLDLLGMNEGDFHREIEGDGNLIVPEGITLQPVTGYVLIEASRLCVSVEKGGSNLARFRWVAYDKHADSVGRLQTYSMTEDDLRSWTKSIGLTLIGI